jgi:hypothetical protein
MVMVWSFGGLAEVVICFTMIAGEAVAADGPPERVVTDGYGFGQCRPLFVT